MPEFIALDQGCSRQRRGTKGIAVLGCVKNEASL
jgi:hypothetical protein